MYLLGRTCSDLCFRKTNGGWDRRAQKETRGNQTRRRNWSKRQTRAELRAGGLKVGGVGFTERYRRSKVGETLKSQNQCDRIDDSLNQSKKEEDKDLLTKKRFQVREETQAGAALGTGGLLCLGTTTLKCPCLSGWMSLRRKIRTSGL